MEIKKPVVIAITGFMVRHGGLEPPTYWTDLSSNSLISYENNH